MAPRYKFNPRTGKFEDVAPVAPSDNSVVPYGKTTTQTTAPSKKKTSTTSTSTTTPKRVDPKTGLPLDASGNVVPVTVPKQKTMSLEEMQAAAAAYVERTQGPAPSTTTSTTAPPSSTPPLRPTATVPPSSTPPLRPTATVPPSTTKADPSTIKGTSSRQGSGVAGQTTGANTPTVISSVDIQGIVDKMIAGSALTPAELAAITALGGGSTTSAAATAATKAAQKEVDDANSYRAGQAAAGIQEQAGIDAQTQYGALAKTQYDTAKTAADTIYTPAVKDTNDYYDKQIANLQTYIDAQNKSATGSIDSATADLLAGLKGTTAYNDVVGVNTAAPTQALGSMLQSYGATGADAAAQQASDAAYGKQIADVFTKGNKQLAGAETDYYTGLQNAARGAQAAGKQNLAEVLARLQGQDRSAIQGNRRAEISALDANKTSAYNSASDLQQQLLGKGIDALMSGKSTAATTRAQTTASYGVPKKPKSKKTTKK
jgi:hypothetical protein